MEEKPARLLSAREVAHLLNIQVSTVYEAVVRGRLPAVRLWQGRRRTLLRFHPEAIERFIHERSTPAEGDPKK